MPSNRNATDRLRETPLVDRILGEDRSEPASASRVDFRDVIDRAWQQEAGDPS